MKKRNLIILLLMVLALTACGKTKLEENMVLLNQDGEEVSFPQDKPTLFFFMTTYT